MQCGALLLKYNAFFSHMKVKYMNIALFKTIVINSVFIMKMLLDST